MLLQKLAFNEKREYNTESKGIFKILEGLIFFLTFVQRPSAETNQEPSVVEVCQTCPLVCYILKSVKQLQQQKQHRK